MLDDEQRRKDEKIRYYFFDRERGDIEHYAHWAERLGRRVRLRRYNAVLKVEGDLVLATSPELDVASQGADVPEALHNLEKAVRGFIATREPGELERRYRKVYTTDFVIEEDPEYDRAILNERRLKVGRLASHGCTPERVAKALGLAVGEVEAMWDDAVAYEEDWQRGFALGREQARAEIIVRMAAEGLAAGRIASLLELDEDDVVDVLDASDWVAPSELDDSELSDSGESGT